MKRYIYGVLMLLSAMLPALTGCSDSLAPDPATELGSDCFSLMVKVPMEAGSRALSPIELNEFKVRSVHFYFYASEGHDDATSPSIYDCAVTEEFDTQRTLRVGLPDNALKAGGIFGTSGTDCIVYAVANVDETLFPIGTPKTIDALKATAISSAFDQSVVQDAFAMDGKAAVSLDRGTRIASGEIVLSRAAAKLTLSVDLPSSITVTGTVINQDGTTSEGETREYYSRAGEMHIWIDNGVKQSLLNTPPAPAAETALYSNEIKAADGIGSAFTHDGAMAKYKYVQNVPFYSYPNKWDATNPDGNTRLMLVVPWWYTDKDGNQQTVTTYYRLAVQPEKCRIERNMYYDMRVTIGRLGGTSIQEPTDMLTEWNYAIPWNEHTLETDIKEIRYLLLNNNYYDSSIGAYIFEMNNETDISVTFGTSHDVEIESVTMSWRDYYNNANRAIALTTKGYYKYSGIAGYNPANIFAGIEVDNERSTLELKREMRHISWSDNRANITSNTAFCAYTFDIKLRHTDDHSRTATIRITQIPAIYITAEETPSGTRFVNKNNGSSNRNKGYVSNQTSTNDLYLGSIHDDDNVKNKNTYVLKISRFDTKETKDYIIADPRTRSVNNLPASGSQTATAAWSMSDDNRQLRYYYPADNNVNKTRYIAPQLRIASQWGVTYVVTKNGAQRRCASYQENGRKAGRWRLPTTAEIEYIANLSCNKYIPFLFGTANNTGNNPAKYWCASGAVNVYNDTGNPRVTTSDDTNPRAVRCVYDEWYWGDDVLEDKTKFTWGDKQRTTSGN